MDLQQSKFTILNLLSGESFQNNINNDNVIDFFKQIIKNLIRNKKILYNIKNYSRAESNNNLTIILSYFNNN